MPRPMDIVFIDGLEVQATIGVHDWERRLRQRLRVDLALGGDTRVAGASDELADAVDYAAVCERLHTIASASAFQLLEALAEAMAAHVRSEFGLPWLRLTLTKPGAVPGARGVGVTIERGEGDEA